MEKFVKVSFNVHEEHILRLVTVMLEQITSRKNRKRNKIIKKIDQVLSPENPKIKNELISFPVTIVEDLCIGR